MPKNAVSKISNAFSTGGGGTNFEQQIQAMFLLSLIVDGFCPAMNEQTKKVCFQAKNLGFDVDDLVIYTYRNHTEGKLLCQVKHSITATKKNKTFKEVICASWNDLKKETFDQKEDRIALATAHIAYASQQALRFLHSQAIGSVDERDFIDKVNLFSYSNQENKQMLDAINSCISVANGKDPTQFELWSFCRVFTLLLFDLDCMESVNRALVTSLINCNSSSDAVLVWSRLVEYAGYYNQIAATVELKNIDSSIVELFTSRDTIRTLATPVVPTEDDFILSVALIGAWREPNKYDQQVIKKIAGIEYEVFKAKAHSMISKNPEYIRYDNGYWKVLHKEELLDQCKKRLFDDYLDRLIMAARTVYSIESSLQSSWIPAMGHSNSKEFRKSLAMSLCWIKREIINLPNCNQEKIEGALYQFIREIFENGESNIWIGNKDCIQYFAEIAPDVFLQEVERSVLNNPQEMLKLFPNRNANLFGQSNHISELLCAIEILAWSPNYLIPSICVLGQLEALPYEKTNWVETPENAIVSILFPPYPQTLADIEKRKNALKCLKNDNETVFWKTIKRLLPNQTHSTYLSPKPKYMSLDIPEKMDVNQKDLLEQYNFLLEMAVETAQGDMDKILFLTKQMRYMNDSLLGRFLDNVKMGLKVADDKQCFDLWLSMRKNVDTIKFLKNDIKESQREKTLQKLIKSIEPKDICLIYQELYLGDDHLLDQGDFATNWKKTEKKKTEAIREIFVIYGIKEIEKFGFSVKEVYDVAKKLGQSLSAREFSDVIDAYYRKEIVSEFFYPCLAGMISVQGVRILLDTSLCNKDTDFILEILSKIVFRRELLEVVNQLLLKEIRYWERAAIPSFCDRISDLELMVNKLIKCKRYIAALNVLGNSDFQSMMKNRKICDLLIAAGTKESIGSDKIDRDAVQKLITWLQKKDDVSKELLSDIEFIYLPLFDSDDRFLPKALYTRISMEPEYFCSMLEMFYKKHSDKLNKFENNLAYGMEERLIKILYPFKITPGTTWEGDFDAISFKKWIASVQAWSMENDRFEVAMQTVGSGLSYANLDSDKLPPKAIVELLNKAENDELRRGYYLGIVNQRGVYWVDPEGKPELELASDYETRASKAESRGYSRYSRVLSDIAELYRREAAQHVKEAKQDNEDEDDI